MQTLSENHDYQGQEFTIPQDFPDPNKPLYCPNSQCMYHDPEKARTTRWYRIDGSHFNQDKGRIKRFRCKVCGKTCSSRTFSTHYWTHKEVNFEDLENKICSCAGQRQIARQMGCTHKLVQNRIRRLARNYLNLYDKALNGFTMSENCAFDGFESFTRSQYFPDNINLLVGEESLSVYGITACILRRKGRMTKHQKEYRKVMEQVWKPTPGALKKSCSILFDDMKNPIVRRLNSGKSWILYTDQHKTYPRALETVPYIKKAIASEKIMHETTSSKEKRTKKNLLFPVNYIDRQLRKNGAEHVRETVRFSREINMSMARAIILCGHNTFRKPYPIPDTASMEGHTKHGEIAGLLETLQVKKTLRNLYTKRSIWSHQKTKMIWMKQIWMESYQNPPFVTLKNTKNLEGVNVQEVSSYFSKSIPARHLVV